MARIYNTARTFIEVFLAFGERLWNALNGPFAVLPAYLGIPTDNGFVGLWAGFMNIIGYVDNTGIINYTTTLEVLGGIGLSFIIVIILWKFFKGVVF